MFILFQHHVITQHSYFEFMECDICSKSFMNSADSNNHKCSMLSTPKEYCSLCSTGVYFIDIIVKCFRNFFELSFFIPVFDSEEKLKIHLSTHKEIVLLKTENSESLLCSKCNDEFKNYSELFSHIENKCDVSNMSLTPLDFAQDGVTIKKEFDDRVSLVKSNQFHSCQHCNET